MAMINILIKYGPRPVTLMHLTWGNVEFQVLRTRGSADGIVRDATLDTLQVDLHRFSIDVIPFSLSW